MAFPFRAPRTKTHPSGRRRTLSTLGLPAPLSGFPPTFAAPYRTHLRLTRCAGWRSYQVSGCPTHLRVDGEADIRFNTYARHPRADEADMHGTPSRHCRQCTKFHPLGEFNGFKHGCRKRLDRLSLRQGGAFRPFVVCAAVSGDYNLWPRAGELAVGRQTGTIDYPYRSFWCYVLKQPAHFRVVYLRRKNASKRQADVAKVARVLVIYVPSSP